MFNMKNLFEFALAVWLALAALAMFGSLAWALGRIQLTLL
jgi:hypothetical protein